MYKWTMNLRCVDDRYGWEKMSSSYANKKIEQTAQFGKYYYY